ncbi:MAG TPA: DNA repair protein RecO [Thermoanaerobaculia bacterium]|jgi:DNA repair protein RecO (recombination protein O)|nr:DNA repair protein RecO [Thermoanaerobaculia bacterium]
MRILSGEAILLDAIDLHERDRVVTFLTAEWGKKRGVARGARAKYSRFAGQLQPLSKVAVRWFEKEGRELVRIESVELIEPCRSLLEDLEGILLASYLAEHLVCFAQENEDSESLYRLLDGTLRWLAEGVDRDLAARYFEVWVLRLAGIFPPPRECPVCGRSLVDVGGAVIDRAGPEIRCRDCATDREGKLSAAALAFLLRTAREAPPAIAGAGAPVAVLREVERACAQVRTCFLHQELRSYQVMQATQRRERELAREFDLAREVAEPTVE